MTDNATKQAETELDWRRRAMFVGAAIFLIAAAFVLAKTARDALFVQGRGLRDLPSAYIGIALLSGPLAWMVLGLLGQVGARTVRLVLPVATAVVLLGLSTVVRPGGGGLMTAFFMFVPLMWGVIFSVSWLLASDLLDGAGDRETARGFATVGASAIGGGVVAGLVGRTAAPYLDSAAFLWASAAALLSAAVVQGVAHRRYPPAARGGAGRPSTQPILRTFLASEYARLLLAVGMAAGAVGVLVELQFYLAAATAGGTERQQAALFASFYLALNFTAFVIQIWIMPRVQHRLGIGGSLLVLPVVLVGGALGLAASATLVAASAVRVTEGSLKSSLHRSSWELAYLPLGPAERPAAKVIVDGMGARIAEGVVALAFLMWLRYVVADGDLAEQNAAWIPVLLALAASGWVLSTRRLRRRLQLDRDAAVHAVPGPPTGACPVTATLGEQIQKRE